MAELTTLNSLSFRRRGTHGEDASAMTAFITGHYPNHSSSLSRAGEACLPNYPSLSQALRGICLSNYSSLFRAPRGICRIDPSFLPRLSRGKPACRQAGISSAMYTWLGRFFARHCRALNWDGRVWWLGMTTLNSLSFPRRGTQGEDVSAMTAFLSPSPFRMAASCVCFCGARLWCNNHSHYSRNSCCHSHNNPDSRPISRR